MFPTLHNSLLGRDQGEPRASAHICSVIRAQAVQICKSLPTQTFISTHTQTSWSVCLAFSLIVQKWSTGMFGGGRVEYFTK